VTVTVAAGPSPTAFCACTLKEYAVPSVRPLTVSVRPLTLGDGPGPPAMT
jgi:hypothetical protein